MPHLSIQRPVRRKSCASPAPSTICLRKKAELSLQRSNQLLRALSQAQSRFFADHDPRLLFKEMLDNLLALMESEYGFIGEVLQDADGQSYVKSHALTNIAWDEATQKWFAEGEVKGLEFRNLNTLYGCIVTTEKPVLSNSPGADPRRGGLPRDHPSLNSFLGLPVHYGGELVGTVGIANRPGGYHQDDVTFLQPFLATCGSLIGAFRGEQRRQKAEADLRHSEERARIMLENSADIISIISSEGIISYESPSVEWVCGYRPEELIGRNAFEYIHPEDAPAVYEAIQKGMTREETQDGEVVSFRCRHKNGAWLYLEALGTNMLHNPYIQGYVVRSRDVTERVHAEQRIQTQLDRLTALRRIDTCINASFDLQLTLNTFLEQVMTQLKVDAAAILVFDPNIMTLEYNTSRGFHVPLPRYAQVGLGVGQAGQAALQRRFQHCADILETPDVLDGLPIGTAEGFVSCCAVPLMSKGQVRGVLQIFHRRRACPNGEWHDFLETLAGQAAIAIDNAMLFEGLQRSNMDLMRAYDATIEGWSHALDLRDHETEGHTQRVTQMTIRLAREFGLNEAEIMHLRRGALLHDIGKMGIPDYILLKPGALTEAEWEIMRRHPVYAYEMLVPIAFLRPALDIPYCHHEKWDGTGYPRGLKAEQIPVCARLFAVADVWDALRSDRPYRPGWPVEKVRAHIESLSGTHFDPQAVEAFLKVVSDQ